MPIYEYVCRRCGEIEERLRKISERDDPAECARCSDPMARMISAPTLGIWNDSRPFPHMKPTGDGTMTFPNRAAYEAHLKRIGATEVGVRAKIARPHGNKVVGTWR